MLATPDGVDQGGEETLIVGDDLVNQWLENGAPTLLRVQRTLEQLILEFEKPSPAVSALKDGVVRILEDEEFPRDLGGRELLVKDGRDIVGQLRVRELVHDGGEEPMTVDGAVPVEAPVEDRVVILYGRGWIGKIVRVSVRYM